MKKTILLSLLVASVSLTSCDKKDIENAKKELNQTAQDAIDATRDIAADKTQEAIDLLAEEVHSLSEMTKEQLSDVTGEELKEHVQNLEEQLEKAKASGLLSDQQIKVLEEQKQKIEDLLHSDGNNEVETEEENENQQENK